MNIRIEYDGKRPCLCMGHLIVWIDNKKWDFGSNVLKSGGEIKRDDDCNMWAEQGEWSIYQDCWPKDFPEEYKNLVIETINEEIPHGCCGGCI